MAIQLVTGNLNLEGNNGYYETDRSTWGFGNNNAGLSFDRSSVQKHGGLYAARVYPYPALFAPVNRATLVRGKFVAYHNRQYVLRAWVYSPAGANLVDLDYSVLIKVITEDGAINKTQISETSRTILQCEGAWVQVESKVLITFDVPANWPNGADQYFHMILLPPGKVALDWSGTIDEAIIEYNANGLLYIDDFEIFEYIDVEDVCDIDIDEGNTVVVNEDTPGADNGSITLAVTGGEAPYEYSKDNGATWQLTNLFENLSAGVYQCRVREVNNPSCVASASFAINSTAPDFDFIIQTTNESLPGANDGEAELTVTGTTPPYEYSKDAGATWQNAGTHVNPHIFTGLAPGIYTFAVKDVNGVFRSYNAEILAGQLVFQKAYFSKNPIPFSVQAYPGYEGLENYRLYCDTRVEEVSGSGIFVSKLKQELTPDEDGVALFQLRSAFREVLQATPTEFTDGITILTDRVKLYKNFIGHLQNDETEPESIWAPDPLQASDPFLVILGGIDKRNYPGLEYLSTYLAANKKFMTWAPLEKQVGRLQEDYLNFFIYNGQITLVSVMVKAYYDDDTNQTFSPAGGNGLLHGQLLQIPAGPKNLNVHALNPEKNLLKYELWLEDQNSNVISEVRTYIVARVSHPLARHLMFLNSLGAWEVIRFTGQAERSEKYERQKVQRFLEHDYESLEGEVAIRDVTSQVRHNFSSGFIKGKSARDWMHHMRELARCRMFYDITSGARIPLMNVTTDFSFHKDQDYEYFIRIEAEDVYINESYTPDL